jgi:hypothetical protein
MSPDTIEFLQSAGNVALGALLGFAGATWSDWWKDRKRARAMKGAIGRELRETAHRFLSLIYTLAGRHGSYNRELLEWMKPQIDRYEGPNPTDGLRTGVTGLLAGSDAAIAEIAAHKRTTTPPQFIPREEPAYTAAIANSIHDLNPDYAVRVLDVLAHIRMLNDARENGLYYTRLSFAGDLTEENHGKAVWNAEQAEGMMLQRARIVIDKISALEDRYPD